MINVTARMNKTPPNINVVWWRPGLMTTEEEQAPQDVPDAPEPE